MNVSIFKTNVEEEAQVASLVPAINEIAGIKCWNFDLEDCDRVLRIEGKKEVSMEIIATLKKFGFDCKELF